MKIYIAGDARTHQTEEDLIKFIIKKGHVFNRLMSFFYKKRLTEVLEYKKTNKLSVMLDSGAFSAWNINKTVNIKEYVELCKKYKDKIDLIVNLDVIPPKNVIKTKEIFEESAKNGYRNYYYMVKKGISENKLIHVFHNGEDFKWLIKMIKEIPYIGLSPMVNKTTNEKAIWLDKCMDIILKKSGTPKVKFHGFAVTTTNLLKRYPWTSVDSSTWVHNGIWRTLLVPSKIKNEFSYSKILRFPLLKKGIEKFNIYSSLEKKTHFRLFGFI